MEKIEDRPTWNSMSTPRVMERMKNLYETSKWHDCIFKLFKSESGSEELVFAHSVVLASSSPVFEALLFGPMADESPICLPDIDPYAFRMMLKFIYTDCVEFCSIEAACNILYAAKKYLIYTLAGLAISYISYQINESNCLKVYEFANSVQEERLIKESWDYLCSHLDEVLKYFPDESLSNDFIKSLVTEEALNGGELVVFNICVLWAKAKCKQKNLEVTGENLRRVLMELNVLSKIRWLTLTLEEFEDGPANSGILEKHEIHFITTVINHVKEIRTMCSKANARREEYYFSDLDKMKYQGYSSDSAISIIQQKLLKTNFPVNVSNIFVARKEIPLKKVYCHRFIEGDMKPNVRLQNGLKINTLITANKSIRLTGIYLNSKILPMTPASTLYFNNCYIERDYKEKLIVTIADNNNKILLSIFFSEVVKYGTVFKIPLRTPVILDRLQEYSIQVDLLNCVENYLFGVRNSVCKFPSGLCVTFKEEVSVRGHKFEANDLSIISGLELCL